MRRTCRAYHAGRWREEGRARVVALRHLGLLARHHGGRAAHAVPCGACIARGAPQAADDEEGEDACRGDGGEAEDDDDGYRPAREGRARCGVLHGA